MPDFYVNISNNIGVTDNEEDQLVPLIVDVNDSITIIEDLSDELFLFPVSLSEIITIAESDDELLSALNIYLFELLNIVESETLLIPELNILKSDSITIIESRTYSGKLYCSIDETVTAAESDNGDIGWQGSVSDSITVADTESELTPTLYLSLFETITAGESISLLIPILYLSKSDSSTISEAITTLGKLFRSVSTSITVSDIEDELDIIHISKSDSIKVIDRFITAPVDPDFTICKTITSVHTMLTSLQRSAGTAYSDSFKVKSTVMVRFHVQITAISGIPTLIITPQVSPDNSVWYDETALGTMYQVDNYTDILKWPGAYVRLKYVIAGTDTPKVTFSAKLVKHMPIREPVLI